MKFVFQIATGIIRDASMRRWTMFVVLIVALVMLFLGSTFLAPVIESRLLVFIGYWGVCGWLTLLALLLAAYDLLIVRAHGRRERQRLRKDIFDDREEK